jgi:hypothetical protein
MIAATHSALRIETPAESARSSLTSGGFKCMPRDATPTSTPSPPLGSTASDASDVEQVGEAKMFGRSTVSASVDVSAKRVMAFSHEEALRTRLAPAASTAQFKRRVGHALDGDRRDHSAIRWSRPRELEVRRRDAYSWSATTDVPERGDSTSAPDVSSRPGWVPSVPSPATRADRGPAQADTTTLAAVSALVDPMRRQQPLHPGL